MARLASVTRTTLREQVLAQLRDNILDGTLAPGTKLGEVDLSVQLGVSRGTVREALRTLQQGGLVEGEERTSLYVRTLHDRELIELYRVRAALEGQAILDIIASPNRDELVDAIEAKLPEVGPEVPAARRFELDLDFHEALCLAGGNGMLLTMWQSAKDLMRLAVVQYVDEESGRLMTKAHHQPIVDALRAGDPDEAQSVIRTHMAEAIETWRPRVGAVNAQRRSAIA